MIVGAPSHHLENLGRVLFWLGFIPCKTVLATTWGVNCHSLQSAAFCGLFISQRLQSANLIQCTRTLRMLAWLRHSKGAVKDIPPKNEQLLTIPFDAQYQGLYHRQCPWHSHSRRLVSKFPVQQLKAFHRTPTKGQSDLSYP